MDDSYETIYNRRSPSHPTQEEFQNPYYGLFGGIFDEGTFDEGIFDGGFYGRRDFCGGKRKQRGKDTFHPIKVSLQDLYYGKVLKLRLGKAVICTKCKGEGGKPGPTVVCMECKGNGVKVTLRQLGPGMVQQMKSKCPECRGEGKSINEKDRCKECRGKKVCQQSKMLKASIEKGMQAGQKITFKGEGDQMPGVEPGDVIIVLQEKEHETYTRKGNDLYATHTIGITEALCGFEFIMKTLDGRTLFIKIPRGQVIKNDDVRVVKGEGMPIYKNPFERGNLYINFKVTFPPNYNFLNIEKIQELGSFLPTRERVEIPVGENVEEVNLMDYEPRTSSEHRPMGDEAYESDDEGKGHPDGERLDCTIQ